MEINASKAAVREHPFDIRAFRVIGVEDGDGTGVKRFRAKRVTVLYFPYRALRQSQDSMAITITLIGIIWSRHEPSSCRLPDDLVRALDATAQELKRSRAEVIRQAERVHAANTGQVTGGHVLRPAAACLTDFGWGQFFVILVVVEPWPPPSLNR